MEASKRAFAPICIAIALLIASSIALACPQEALAMASPWGAGTTYSAKTATLTVKSGKHTIKSLYKTRKGKMYRIEKLVIKGGTTNYSPDSGYLESLTVRKGKLTSSTAIMVSESMRVSGGTVAIASSKRNGEALLVMDDLTITGGKVTSKTKKEGCTAIWVVGDMRLKKGSVTASARGKSANGLQVSGFLKVYGGKLKSTTSGKYGSAVRVYGDLLMSKGSISATSSRDLAIYCSDLLKITGGKVSAKSASGQMAIQSGETASVKLGCLGAIKGRLPEGVRFSKGGATYQVASMYSPEAKVVKGNPRSETVAFGGVTYAIETKLVAGSAA